MGIFLIFLLNPLWELDLKTIQERVSKIQPTNRQSRGLELVPTPLSNVQFE